MPIYSELGSCAYDNLVGGCKVPLINKGVTLLAGQGTLKRGSVIGIITVGAATAAAKTGGNTGNGTLTMDGTTPILSGAQSGVYSVRCVGVVPTATGTPTAAAKSGGNTGNGTITMDATTPRLSNAIPGVYTVRCITANTNAATFELRDPNGNQIQDVALSGAGATAAFATQVKFVITDGTTDFAVGDGFDITVAKEDLETFRVTAPDGDVIGEVAAGGTFSNQIKFAVADGTTDFVIGDGFDITVAVGSKKGKLCNRTAVDGSQIADCVLAADTDTTADALAVCYQSGEFIREALIFGSGDSAANHEDELRDRGIYLRSEIVVN